MNLISKIFKSNWLVFAVLAAVVFGVYANILDNDFVWDDYVFIYNWDAIKKPIENINELLFSLPERQTNLRPIKNVFYAANYQFFGDEPIGYHAVAITIHILNSWFVYLIAKKILKKKRLGFAAAILFGVHPINVEAVAWVTASMDTLGHTFFLLSFWLYMNYREGQKNNWLWFSYIAAAMAFLTNELTFSLVPTIVFYDLLIRKINPINEFGVVKKWLGFFGLILSYFILKFIVHGSGTGFVMERIWIGFISLTKYLRLLFLPSELTVNHFVWGEINAFYNFDLPFVSNVVWPKITDTSVLASLTTLVVMIIIAIKFRKKYPVPVFSFFGLLFSFLPVMQVVPTTAIFAERYAYLASAFFGMFLVCVAVLLFEKFKLNKSSRQIILSCLFLILMIFYGVRTVQRNNDWQSALSLWTEAVDINPVSAMNYANLGKAYLDKTDLENAQFYLDKSVGMNPNYPVALANLGAVNNINGKYEVAVDYYSKALSLDNKFIPARNGLAVAYLGVGEYEKARSLASEIVEKNNKSVFGNLVIAKSFHKQFIFNQAENYYLKVLELESENLDALNNLGNLYVEWGRNEEARVMYERVLAIDESYGEVKEKVGKLMIND